MKSPKNKTETGVSLEDETVMNEYPNNDFSTSEKTLLRCIGVLENHLCTDVSEHLDKHSVYKPDISIDQIQQLLGVPEVLDRIWTEYIPNEDLDRPFKGFETWLQFCDTVENLDNGDRPRFELNDSELYDLLKCSLKILNYIHWCPIEGLFDPFDCDKEKDQKVQMKEVV